MAQQDYVLAVHLFYGALSLDLSSGLRETVLVERWKRRAPGQSVNLLSSNDGWSLFFIFFVTALCSCYT